MLLIILILVFVFMFSGGMGWGMPQEQKQTLESLQKITDNLYVLDYTYDYDIDELLERGVSSTADMLAYASTNVLGIDNGFHWDRQKGGCSTFNAKNTDGDAIFGRNFDYYRSPTILVWTHPKNGYASVGTVNGNFLLYTEHLLPDCTFNRRQLLLSPYVCMDGMNEKGLTIAVLELDTEPVLQDTEKVDLTNTCIIRAVLDKAATVDEAIDIFRNHDIRDQLDCNYHYQIADASGASVIVEYADGGQMNLIYPQARDQGHPYQCLTNYFLSYPKDHPCQAECFGWDRVDAMNNTLSSKNGILSQKEAMTLLSDVHLDEYMDGALFKVVTVWSEVYNLTDRTIDICVAMDYSKTYTFSLDSPCAYICS